MTSYRIFITSDCEIQIRNKVRGDASTRTPLTKRKFASVVDAETWLAALDINAVKPDTLRKALIGYSSRMNREYIRPYALDVEVPSTADILALLPHAVATPDGSMIQHRSTKYHIQCSKATSAWDIAICDDSDTALSEHRGVRDPDRLKWIVAQYIAACEAGDLTFHMVRDHYVAMGTGFTLNAGNVFSTRDPAGGSCILTPMDNGTWQTESGAILRNQTDLTHYTERMI